VGQFAARSCDAAELLASAELQDQLQRAALGRVRAQLAVQAALPLARAVAVELRAEAPDEPAAELLQVSPWAQRAQVPADARLVAQ
jgi:hypothetical protein